jgi:hypothetical protein
MCKTKEIWKDIPNYEGYYQVSDLGRVKSLKRKGVRKDRFLVPTKFREYYYFSLMKDNKNKKIQISRILYSVFKGELKKDMVIDHIDNNPSNNSLGNLQQISIRENLCKDKKGSSKYRGVSWSSAYSIWISQICFNGKNKYLGRFKNEYDAHLAYQKELKQIENDG